MVLRKWQFVLLVDFPFHFQIKGFGLLGLCRLFLFARSGVSWSESIRVKMSKC